MEKEVSNTESNGYEVKLDMNVLNHLGMSLYSNTPAVLTEIISNSWDADAKSVEISLDQDNQEIIIKDDGHGMSSDDIAKRFLKVGYARRSEGRSKSESGDRQVMGRKGIGKLAMFSLARVIEVTSKKIGESPVSFEIDVELLQERIKQAIPYRARIIERDFEGEKGTLIKLLKLKKNISSTESYLRKKVARRFSIIGENNDFKVVINNTPISSNDRDFLKELQFLWEIGKSDPDRLSATKNLENKGTLEDKLVFKGREYLIKGYVGGVKYPSDLKKDREVSNNTITVMSNGRIFDEDILPQFGSAKHFTNYLVGEIEIDLLDRNDHEDMATSSRQKLQENDPRYSVLKAYFEKILLQVDKDWDEWRREIGAKEAVKESPVLKEWFESLKGREKKAAKKLVGQINTMRFSGDEDAQKASKKEVLKSAVLAFEKLRVKDNLDMLDKITDINSETFKAVFSSINDIEESLYYDITSQRLKVIEKFNEISGRGSDELEKVVQEYLFDHLWLLDPSWERVSGTQEMERTLTKELKKIKPDSEKGARLDIEYKTISGKHIIIEMKKPSLTNLKIDNLREQGRKYLLAVRQWYKDNPASCPHHGIVPQIEVIFLLGKNPKEAYDDADYYNIQLSSINAKIMTYTDLICQSSKSYGEYIKSQEKFHKIKNITDNI
ncbi:ATP-binding protein [Idiomarina abyssalis]|uniref:BbrUII/HgiDII family restriction enzyme n=1 Tax=Idiomarina abyssalis TaxID=86102 RepID=UPI003A9490B8